MISYTKTYSNRVTLFHEPFNNFDLQCAIPWADVTLGIKTSFKNSIVRSKNFCESWCFRIIKLRVCLVCCKPKHNPNATTVIYTKTPSCICQNEALVTSSLEIAHPIKNSITQKVFRDRFTQSAIMYFIRWYLRI